MAKGNALLGTLRGSTGDVTFRVSNGRQVMSKRARVVRNPKTSKQTYQRMFFATIAKAQSAMKKIVDHSFENVEHGSKSLRYFTSKNVALMRQNAKYDYGLQAWVSPGMSFVPPRTVGATFNKYRVSEGSLSPNNVMNFVKTIEGLDDLTPNIYLPPFTNNLGNYIRQSSDFGTREIVDAVDEMLRNEGCQPGDYMTAVFMSAKQNDINAAGAGVFYPCQFHYVRFKVVTLGAPQGTNPSVLPVEDSMYLIPSNIDGKVFEFPTQLINDDALELPLYYPKFRVDQAYYLVHVIPMAVGGQFIYSPSVGDSVTIDISFDFPLIEEDDQILCATWIHSRPDGDKILCSTQDMVLYDPTGDVFDFNLGLMDAYDAWNQGVVAVGNSEYILEGGNK